MSDLITYLNDPTLKTRFVVEITEHEAADQIIQGTYGRMNGTFRGCAIGCSLHSLNRIHGRSDSAERTDDHSRYVTELGLPLWLAYIEDHVFESLPIADARTWPRRFAEAIPVGAVVDDLILAKILRWCLADDTWGVRHATDDAKVRAIVDHMATLFDRSIAGDEPSAQEWDEAAWAARDAWAARAARAARAAWDARDAWAARAAWDARDAWAARAAWAARDARAARAARDARDAWDARAARDAWDAWDAAAKASAFTAALAEYVLALLRELPVEAPVVHHRV